MRYSGGLERSHELHAHVYDLGLLVVSLALGLKSCDCFAKEVGIHCVELIASVNWVLEQACHWHSVERVQAPGQLLQYGMAALATTTHALTDMQSCIESCCLSTV